MKKTNKKENYLEKIPNKSDSVSWSEEGGVVTLSIENKGIMNKICQKLFKKPKTSYVHLDELGSFVWKATDGEKKIMDVAIEVKEHFRENAEPLYERLAKYYQILESYGFVTWNK